jgi:hypothetical protein
MLTSAFEITQTERKPLFSARILCIDRSCETHLSIILRRGVYLSWLEGISAALSLFATCP